MRIAKIQWGDQRSHVFSSGLRLIPPPAQKSGPSCRKLSRIEVSIPELWFFNPPISLARAVRELCERWACVDFAEFKDQVTKEWLKSESRDIFGTWNLKARDPRHSYKIQSRVKRFTSKTKIQWWFCSVNLGLYCWISTKLSLNLDWIVATLLNLH